ncbi:pre-mRNA-splicing factor CWC25, putative [Entamoeba dispar SAW760]|uniref:Pre-mRNA-splicing factor CWC25, putative n=1 Tax=Entamoeba dispar (strain ATCC PRA-260 / SAW760) TaxID=370354 RepID=B0ELY3_ENTDS|nr:pre-mRNA-splicing factor CWC25, putative [Entamoeba dispar SAW760]EDR24463.1 pre-mRNA-splicing factor CWC25, putative [Entamoeba dispar SAW760]|eukprot:EDR24463.1 pre-mRNA-splicing factor CWC25, putative [Entamoeba dispar SAW760]
MNKGFLSKKSFHPAKLSNQKKVWEAERRKEEEKHQIEVLKKERLEELEREEEEKKNCLLKGEKYVERLNWMYEAPTGFEEQPKEEIIRKEDKQEKQNGKEDCLKKISKDPIAMAKERRKEEIQKIMKNPMKLREIEEKEIKRLINRWDIDKTQRESIQKKIWTTSEKGKVGEEIIRKHDELFKWWREMKREQRMTRNNN